MLPAATGGLRVITLLKAAAGHRHDARLFVGEIDLIARLRSFGRRLRRLAARLLARGRNLVRARREFGFMLRQFARVTFLGARFDLRARFVAVSVVPPPGAPRSLVRVACFLDLCPWWSIFCPLSGSRPSIP